MEVIGGCRIYKNGGYNEDGGYGRIEVIVGWRVRKNGGYRRMEDMKDWKV